MRRWIVLVLLLIIGTTFWGYKGKDKEIMTAKEVAEYLSIHTLTVHKFAREGRIPAFKMGADWRFHRKYIDRWIKEKLDSNIVCRS